MQRVAKTKGIWIWNSFQSALISTFLKQKISSDNLASIASYNSRFRKRHLVVVSTLYNLAAKLQSKNLYFLLQREVTYLPTYSLNT